VATCFNQPGWQAFPTHQHLEAFFYMQNLIQATDLLSRRILDEILCTDMSAEDLQWSNVVAATIYQKTSLQIMKKSKIM
jgi:hypothetical protein